MYPPEPRTPAERLALAGVEVARTMLHHSGKASDLAKAELHGLARAADYHGHAMTPAAFELACIETSRSVPALVMKHVSHEAAKVTRNYHEEQVLEAFANCTCVTI